MEVTLNKVKSVVNVNPLNKKLPKSKRIDISVYGFKLTL